MSEITQTNTTDINRFHLCLQIMEVRLILCHCLLQNHKLHQTPVLTLVSGKLGQNSCKVQFFLLEVELRDHPRVPIIPTSLYICQGLNIWKNRGRAKQGEGSMMSVHNRFNPTYSQPNSVSLLCLFIEKIPLRKNMTKLHSINKLGMVEKKHMAQSLIVPMEILRLSMDE